jgi:hypothetical protein
MTKITVENTEITLISNKEGDYISLTDMANAKVSKSRAADIIKNWIRTRYSLEFLEKFRERRMIQAGRLMTQLEVQSRKYQVLKQLKNRDWEELFNFTPTVLNW